MSEKYKKYYEAKLKENAEAKKQADESKESGEPTSDWTKY
jgi:hypothetical protein